MAGSVPGLLQVHIQGDNAVHGIASHAFVNFITDLSIQHILQEIGCFKEKIHISFDELTENIEDQVSGKTQIPVTLTTSDPHARHTAEILNRELKNLDRERNEYLDGEDYVFDKRFFDMLKYTPKLEMPHTNKGSYESLNGRKVVLDNDSRAKASPWEKKAVVYHEFGHAIGDQRDLIYRCKELEDLRNKQIARLRKRVKSTKTEYKYDYGKGTYTTTTRETTQMYAKELSARIDAVLARIRKFGDGVFTRRGITKKDVVEQIGSLQDTLKSLVNSPGVGWGHSTSYFNSTGMRRHEYLAHCFENAFLGNRVFQHFMPTEYQEMIDFINSLKFS